MAKDKKSMTPKEYREQLIKDRAARLKRDAAKQGITPAELAKKKRDTYVKVVGGAASLLPIGRIISLAGKGVKALTTGAKTTKAAKTTRAKSAGSKPTTKPKTSTASKSNRAKSQGGRTAAQAKQAPKKPAAKKPAAKKQGLTKTQRAILGGAVTSATLATIDDIRKSGKGKAVAAPTSRPKRPTVTGPKARPKPKTGMSSGNTVAGSSGRDPRTRNAPNVGLGKMKKVPTTKSRDKDGQGTGKIDLPAGAKRKFQGSYNSKKEKLRNIGGKTYVFNK